MTFEEYLAIDALNASGIKNILRSPAYYRYRKLNPSTPAQYLGTLTHLAILEPEEFEYKVVILPEFNLRTKAGKADKEKFEEDLSADIYAVTPEQHRLALAMRDAVMHQPFARALLADGKAEQTVVWTDEEHRVDCKARLDWICGAHDVIVDLKTAKDASEDAFRRSAANYGYHIQAAWYREGAYRCDLGERTFVFIVVESDPPHGVALYQLDEQSMHVGWVKSREALATYAECRRTGTWPGYPTEIQQLSLPPWVMT